MSDQSGESSNQEEGADATEDYNEDRDRGARRLLRRLTLNEWLTLSYLLAQPKDDPYGNPVPVDLDAASEHPDDPIEYKVVPDPRGAGPIT